MSGLTAQRWIELNGFDTKSPGKVMMMLIKRGR